MVQLHRDGSMTVDDDHRGIGIGPEAHLAQGPADGGKFHPVTPAPVTRAVQQQPTNLRQSAQTIPRTANGGTIRATRGIALLFSDFSASIA